METIKLLAELESVKKRISELESQKKNNLALFGRSYSQVGDSNSDFLIKTKGQVKIQWGTKFIDLIKEGKINVDTDFIFSVKTQDKIGSKNGIYVTDDGYVYLKIGDHLLNLVGEIGTTYVSFIGEQETDSTSKYTALKNLGFLYPNLESLDETSLQNGIIYVESEKKLYIVQNGQLEEFTIAFPNPFTEQFIIQKNDTNIGSLLIKGSGKSNSIAFDSFYIFTESGNSYLQADGEINIQVGNNVCINVTQQKTTINNIVQANTFQSIGANSNTGFMLYKDNNGSTLIVDNLIVRNDDTSIQTSVYPAWWSLEHNVVTKVEAAQSDDLGQGYAIHLKYKNEYKVGDYLYLYGDIQDGDDVKVVKIPVLVRILNTETKNIVYVQIISELLEDLQALPDWVGRITFLVGSEEEKLNLLRYSQHHIDLLECQDISEEQDVDSIQTRIGMLDELSLKERDNTLESDPEINGLGIFSKQSYFLKAGYVSDYQLEEDDDSSKFASTEWVNKKLQTTVDIDFTIQTKEVDPKEYFTQESIQELWSNQLNDTVVSYVGYYGVLTISKTESTSTFSAIVRAKTDNDTWSHRSINSTYEAGTWYSSSTYIIQDQINPGYYWARELSNGKPISPEYIGTTDQGFQVSESKPYLLYTNDGQTWTIVSKYVPPVETRIYILSTNMSTVITSGVETVYPSGFFCYWKDGQTMATPFGKSNYSEPTTQVNTVPDLSMLDILLGGAEAGSVPSASGYFYLWSIEQTDSKTVPSNWQLESSGSLPVTIVHKDTCDWGNSSLRPGYEIWEVDDTNTIIGKPAVTDFTEGSGTDSAWTTDPSWRKSFLEAILGQILTANAHNYHPTFGWRFNWSGILKSTGYAGFWTARIGGLQSPTSDDPNDISYLPTATLNSVNGQVMDNGALIEFTFTGVKLGKLLPYRYALGGYQIGDKLQAGTVDLYEVSYEKCYYRRTQMSEV